MRDAIGHIQDEMNRENDNDAPVLLRENARQTVTDRLLAHIRQRWPAAGGHAGRRSKKRPTARRLRSCKARATRRR